MLLCGESQVVKLRQWFRPKVVADWISELVSGSIFCKMIRGPHIVTYLLQSPSNTELHNSLPRKVTRLVIVVGGISFS
jgi:hypothetical protein